MLYFDCMKIVVPASALLFGIITFPALAQDDLKPFSHESTVGDFALECQHPIKKSHPNERVALCVTHINSAVQQVALTKRSPECWNEIEGGKAAPGPLMDVLFFLASQPDGRSKKLDSELRNIVVELAATSCK